MKNSSTAKRRRDGKNEAKIGSKNEMQTVSCWPEAGSLKSEDHSVLFLSTRFAFPLKMMFISIAEKNISSFPSHPLVMHWLSCNYQQWID